MSAGSSGNQRYGSLGLFGMGFNIATARLGNKTEVWTSRETDDEWLVATVDLRAMQKAESFVVPLRREPKEPGEHGTRVIVSQIRPEIMTKVRSQGAPKKLRQELGDVYSYLLREPSDGKYSGDKIVGGVGIRLMVNGTAVEPRLPCIWSPDRHVSRSGTDIPAVIPIDQALTDAWACMTCGHWQELQVETCSECGSSAVELRARSIRGWIGIQRYLDKSDFGIDILRQGRKILTRDKSLFNWLSPDGDLNAEVEYPVELGSTQGGRIVGEIHLDHIPVNFRKSDFNQESRDWATMVRVVRGESPIREQIAKSRGYNDPNNSPLARLFKGYRRNNPGLNYLVPGDGKVALRAKAQDWATRFRRSDPDFMTDLTWYTTALAHDLAARGDTLPDEAVSGGTDGEAMSDVVKQELISLGLGDLIGAPATPTEIGPTAPDEDDADTDSPEPPVDEPVIETEAERFERYRTHSRVVLGMDSDISLPEGNSTHLTVLATHGVKLLDSGAPRLTVARLVGGNLEVYVNEDSDVFTQYGWDVADVALVATAETARSLYRLEDWKINSLIEHLVKQFEDRKVTEAALRERSDDVLDRVREAIVAVTGKHADELWACLSASEKQATEAAALTTASEIDWTAALNSGDYGRFLTAEAVARMVQEHPGLLLDGQAFRRAWATWKSDEVKERAAASLAGWLMDLGTFLSDTSRLRPQELQRVRITLDLLRQEVVDS